MNKSKFAIILAALLFSISACKTSDVGTKPAADKSPATETAKTDGEKDVKDVKWSNKGGETGPENWARLEMENNACGGKVQSPIDIVTKDAKPNDKLTAIKFDYSDSDVDIVNNGHTIQFNVSGDNKVTIGDKEYKLLQFHFHAGSEHTIDGKQYPLDVHFVHKNSDSDYAVLGLMYEEGAENALFAKYMKDFPAEKARRKAKAKLI